MNVSAHTFVIAGGKSRAFALPTLPPGTTIQQVSLNITNLGSVAIYAAVGNSLEAEADDTATEIAAGGAETLTLAAGNISFAIVASDASTPCPCAVAIGI